MSTINELAHRLRWVIIGLLAAGASISLWVGVRGAIASSKDFQWAGAYLLRTGVDPWQEALLGHGHAITHFSPPNYLHEFYVFLLPLSMLSFRHATELWCCLSILMSVASIYLLKQLFTLSWAASIAILLVLWMSTPFRTMLQVGQVSAFELVLLCIVFCTSNSTLRGLALGLSFSKYSFAPVVVSLLWFKHNIRTLTIAVTVALLGLLMVWGMLGGSLIQLASEPFAVSRINVWPGMADLMTSIQAGLEHWLPAFTSAKTAAYGIGLLASGAYGFFLSRRRISEAAQLTLVAVASLLTVKHLMYDYIFLVVPLSYALSERGRSIRPVAIPMIGLFWFMDKLFPLLPMNATPSTAQWLTSTAGCLMLVILLIYLTWSILRLERVYYAKRTRRGVQDRRRVEVLSTLPGDATA